MAEIVNLRRVKKRLAREAASRDAAAARARNGRTTSERAADVLINHARETALDGARLDDSDGDREPRE
jgi:Domain of unknown function (DUF4169)